jgi:hypothetical protein
MGKVQFILKFQNRKDSTNEMVFTSSRQGVDKTLDATTWWSPYLDCNAYFIHFFLFIFCP